MTGPPLETKVAYLRRPETYRDRPTRVDAIETHMSFEALAKHGETIDCSRPPLDSLRASTPLRDTSP